MAQKNNRNKRRGPVNDTARTDGSASSVDRYQKFLPEWMRGTNGAPPPRPRGPRRARPARPAGGYTPGKLASGNS